MGAIRLSSFRKLSQTIQDAIPELKGNVFIQPSDGSQSMPFSDPLSCPISLEITRSVFTYFPEQRSVVFTADANSGVVKVGYHEGEVELRLAAPDPDERAEAEQALLELWLGSVHPVTGQGRPGVLVTEVIDITRFGPFIASWELDDGDWKEEAVFDRSRQSILSLNAMIPALATVGNLPTIESLRLAFTEDFDAVFDSTVTTAEGVEVVSIAQDGTITPA